MLAASHAPLVRASPAPSQEGGTGGIWKAVAKLLPAERQRYKKELVSIDKEAQARQGAGWGRQVQRAGGGATLSGALPEALYLCVAPRRHRWPASATAARLRTRR